MSLRTKNALSSLTALALGGSLYILFRSGSYIGNAASAFGLVACLREYLRPLSCEFLRFYLPDMLWALSLACGLVTIWGQRPLCCAGLAFALGCLWELMQAVGIVNGTGDLLDVMMYLLGGAICVQINLKERTMKKINVLLMALLIAMFAVFALGSTEGTEQNQGTGSVENGATSNGSADHGSVDNGSTENDKIGKYSVEIKSCRLAKDYEKKPVVIVKYTFTNVSNDGGASFWIAFNDQVYQNGVGLNEALILPEDANYDYDNQTKTIKKGASIDVEVAYVLNDTTTDIEVEVKELFSFSDTVIKKTFSIA